MKLSLRHKEMFNVNLVKKYNTRKKFSLHQYGMICCMNETRICHNVLRLDPDDLTDFAAWTKTSVALMKVI